MPAPAGERFSHDGTHYRLTDSPGLPKPVQPLVPVIVGGNGPRRTPSLAARYATEFNLCFSDSDGVARQYANVRAACEEIGRDPVDLVWSVALPAVVGRDDAEVRRRAQAVGRDVASGEKDALVGTPAQVVERIGEYREAGAQRLYVQLMDMSDLDHVELIAGDVMPDM